MGTTAEKLTYLNNTKQLLKENINNLGGNLTTEPFRQYASVLEDIYEQIPKVSGIGSSLSLSPTMAGRIKLNEIQGNTYQNGTPTPSSPVPIENVTGLQNINICGKNLFDKNNIKKINAYFDSEGGSITSSDYNRVFYIPCNSNTTYTITQGISTLSNHILQIATTTEIPNINVIVSNYINYTSLTPQTYTTNATAKYLVFRIRSGDDVSSFWNGVQIELGSTATTYEPYTSQSYEVNLGKNLLPNTATSQTINGITFTKNDDGTVLVNGTSGNSTIFYNLIEENSLPLNTNGMFLSGCPSGGSTTSYELRVTYTNNTNDRDIGNGTTLGNKTIKVVMIRLQANTRFDNLLFKPMIEKGSQATSYTPYFTPIELNKIGTYQDSIKKSTGKNLFDKTNITTGNRLDPSGEPYPDTNCFLSDYIPVEPNTIYTRNITPSTYECIGFYTSSKTFISRNTSNATTTTPSNAYYVRITGYNTNLDTLMLNEGSTALPYEPYGKVWYIHKETDKYNIDTSQITVKNYYTNIEYATIPQPNNYAGKGSYDSYDVLFTNGVLDDTPATSQPWDSTYRIGKISNKANNNEWWEGFTKGTGLSNIQTALTGSYIIYPLATPTTTEITNTTLIEQLESLYNAKSKDNITNIIVTSENLPAILNVSALKGDVE